MHFSVMVVIPPGYKGDVGEYVDKAMAPYDENAESGLTWVVDTDDEEGGYWTNEQSFWDWYQIGGRWSGHFARDDYDPEKDRRNWETCDICGGTGQRGAPGTMLEAEGPCVKDGKPYCNGCSQHFQYTGEVGVRVKWRTQWVSDTGNVARLGDVREYVEGDGRPYYLVHEGLSRSETRNPDWDRTSNDYSNYMLDTSEEVVNVLKKLSDDCTLVVVDCHS